MIEGTGMGGGGMGMMREGFGGGDAAVGGLPCRLALFCVLNGSVGRWLLGRGRWRSGGWGKKTVYV